ncbi:MAG: ATP-dependent helicase [Desulforegulaceae bacterium]|nr:ATP-dependent helicase [Desulforegulaceae bacterium]
MFNLSKSQQNAVKHINGPALVVAGAGSGKTRTLTAKIAHLVNSGFDSRKILAITFTNKAADEMKQRLFEITGLDEISFPWVRTYHSACYKIFKDEAHHLGYKRPLQILDIYHQQKIVEEVLVKMNIDKKNMGEIRARISIAKNYGDPFEYFQLNPFTRGIRIEDIFKEYEKIQKEQNALDFDNILYLTRNLLRDNKEVKTKYQNMFDYILIDEYQDTNNLQEELTQLLLGHDNLFCVGDDWQSVYGFRGSNVDHFLSFKKKYPKSKIFRLEENFRSCDEIVKAANHLIGYNEDRMDKSCYSAKKGGEISTHYFADEEQEALWIGKKIQKLNIAGIDYSDIAVIYRTKFCSRAFEKAFRMLRIPYRLVGDKGFFERKEILDLNCYLTASCFPMDDTAFARILNIPKRGIGPAMLKKINSMRLEGMSFSDAAKEALKKSLLSAKVHENLKSLIDVLNEIKTMSPNLAIEYVISKTDYFGYLESISKTPQELLSRKENIQELIASAGLRKTIEEYLEEAALVREDKESEDQEDPGKGVNLSTVHACKGLEFNTVFVAGCEEELFPHWKSMDSSMELQEERRLMYVAITRAEFKTFLTCADFRQNRLTKTSRFLKEIEEYIAESE